MEDPTFPFPNLPNDVIIEILTRLPVKPLLQFKCVCKSWRALISSQRFAKSHLENSKSDPNLTAQRLLMELKGNFKQLSANSILYEHVPEASDLSPPFQLDGSRKVVLGSCNGLLFLGGESPIPGNANHDFRVELILWNPSTGIRKELPLPDTAVYPRGTLMAKCYGFGYDKSSDDYKVVRFFLGDMDVSDEPKVMLQVYSLRNDQWKMAKAFGVPSLEMSRRSTLVNGKLYRIGNSRDSKVEEPFVFCFDLETEEYDILRLPDCVSVDHYEWLGESGGSLWVMCFHIVAFDVWRWNGCGLGKENWAKVVTFPSPQGYFWFPTYVLYGMDCTVVFLPDGPIAISDAKSCSARYLEIADLAGGFRVCGAYIESLVSPLGW